MLLQHVQGFTMLTGTLLLWIASSVAVQMIFGGPVQYRKPMFLTLFNSASASFLLLPRLADAKTSIVASIASVRALSGTAGLVWLCSQFMFNLSLEHTSVATNTVLSSTSSVFTFVFSLCICRDRFRWRTCGAAFLSCCGCAMVARQSPETLSADAVTTSSFGDALAVSSAALFALASVLLRKWAPRELDMSTYMGVNGLLSLVLAPVLLSVVHFGGMESFTAPSGRIMVALAMNAVFGCSCANYLYTRAMMLLTPVVANMYMCLSIPLSALTDEVLLGEHRFSFWWAVGASMSCAAVAYAALDLEVSDEELRGSADEDELETLMGSMGDDDYDSSGKLQDMRPVPW